jgi:LysR family transcriptional regulator, carnitine catabolism transcriptional activator
MEVSELKTFLLVARGGGLPHASKNLRLSTAAISQRLKRLETEIGAKLFERRPNGLLLTPKGRLFLSHAQRILEDLEKSVSMFRENEGICTGSVSVALANDLAFFLAPYIAGFLKKHPMVKLSMLTRSSTDALELVLDGHVEIGIGRFTAIPSTLERIPLFSLSLVAVYPTRHPLALVKRPSLADLAAHGLILHNLNSSTRRAIDQIFASRAVEVNPVIEASTCYAIKQYVKLGLGVGLMHNICAFTEKDPDLKTSDLRNIFGRWDVVLIHKSRELTLAHKTLIETLSRMQVPSFPKRTTK